jgi:hypothetical protein
MNKEGKMRLPITEGLIHGESLHGCILRHTELNLYEGFHWIGSLVGLDTTHTTCFTGLSQAEALGDLLDIPEADIQATSYVRRDAIGYTLGGFGGQTFSRPLIDFANVGVCPECLCESAHIRQVWDLSLLVACPHHGRLLLRSCPECDRKLKWGRSTVCFCDCGFDMRTAEMPSVSEATQRLMELFYVVSREPSAAKDFGFANLPTLQRLGLEQLVDLILYLEKWLSPGKRLSVLSLPRMTVQDRIQLCTDVARVFQSWPDGWRKVIVDFATRRLQQNGKLFGLQRIFGGLYTKLFDKSERHIEFLRDEFLRAASDGEVSLMCSVGRNCVAFGEKLTQNKYVPARDARDIMAIGQSTFEWLKEIGKLEIQTRQIGQKEIHLITRESVAVAKAYLDSLMSPSQISKSLGVTVSMVERFTKGGALSAVRGKSVDGYRNWMFERAEVENFRRQLNRAAKHPLKKETGRLIPLTAAIMGVRTFGVQAAQVLNAIFDSRLRAFKVVEAVKKVDDVLIGHREVMAYARSLASSGPHH